MNDLTKQKKIDFIRELVEKHKITAYIIAKNTNLTESGVQRVLNGSTQNPHINTVNGIYNYIMELYPADIELSTTGPENEEMAASFATHQDEIKKNLGNLMETLIIKLIEEQTAGKFDAINNNILTLFKNQMAQRNTELKNKVKPLSKSNGAE